MREMAHLHCRWMWESYFWHTSLKIGPKPASTELPMPTINLDGEGVTYVYF